jgi:hypothetical protein
LKKSVPVVYCPKCGSEVGDTALKLNLSYCTNCGFKITSTAQPPQQVPQVTKTKSQGHALRTAVVLILVFFFGVLGLLFAFNLVPGNNGNVVPSGYTTNGDGTYCPTGYPYYAPSTGTCYQEQNNGLGSGGSVFVYTPQNNGAAGWTVQATGSDTFSCSSGNQGCSCSSQYVHTYTGVTSYRDISGPGNAVARSETGYQYPTNPSLTLTNGYPFPDSAFGVVVVESSAGQSIVYCVSAFRSSAPPV